MGILLKRVVSCAMVCLIGMASVGITTVEMPITTISASADDSYQSWRQGDSRWGSMRLGGSSYTMSNSGCAATALAMLMVHSGSITDSSFTPGTLCTFFNNNGGFSNRGDISWGVSNKLASSFTFEGYATLSSDTVSGKADELEKYLDAGYYIILGVKNGGHWVAVDKVEGDKVYVFDPANGKHVNVFDAYSNSGIYKVRKFYGANSVIEEDVAPEVTEQETTAEELLTISSEKEESVEVKNSSSTSYSTGLYKLNSELCFRTDAYTSADVIDIIPNGTSINVSEVNGEWGYVCYNANMGWINLSYTDKVQSSYKYSTGTYTTAEPLNFRESNSTSADSYGLIPINSTIEILEVKNNWGKVNYASKEAWVCLNYASEGNAEFSSAVNVAVSNSSKKIGVYVTNDNLNVRAGNDTSFTKLDLIPKDTEINVIEIDGNWGKAIYGETVGWVCLDYADYSSSFKYIPGDINDDGLVNIQDLFVVSSNLKTGESFTQNEIKLVDFNEDGVVNSTDYIIFKNIILY
ncbi:MAG: SH3 domain-containing protein [Ruminococcus sp.]|nr:SH3 domain-containing protein [Ruminococcus sp.]